jgi:hypothetical protein
MHNVAVILRTIKARILELITPVKKGFISVAPKYKMPITVVKQSIEPMSTSLCLRRNFPNSIYYV